jgi:hypothetical protein
MFTSDNSRRNCNATDRVDSQVFDGVAQVKELLNAVCRGSEVDQGLTAVFKRR